MCTYPDEKHSPAEFEIEEPVFFGFRPLPAKAGMSVDDALINQLRDSLGV